MRSHSPIVKSFDCVERDHPRRGQQQHDSPERREAQSQLPAHRALLRRQPAREDRDEHQVVDAQHNLERRERDKCQKRRNGEQFSHGGIGREVPGDEYGSRRF